jgi:hypothetical protein
MKIEFYKVRINGYTQRVAMCCGQLEGTRHLDDCEVARKIREETEMKSNKTIKERRLQDIKKDYAPKPCGDRYTVAERMINALQELENCRSQARAIDRVVRRAEDDDIDKAAAPPTSTTIEDMAEDLQREVNLLHHELDQIRAALAP